MTLEAVLHAPGTPASARRRVPFGDAGWSVRLDELGLDLRRARTETVLDAYADLLDPARAPAVLTEVLRSGTRGRTGLALTRADSQVLRHKPGSRCTFRVHVGATGRAPPTCRRR